MRLAWKPGRGAVPSMGWQHRGGGGVLTMPVPQEWRGTSMQVCGLWPFSIGSGTPMVGVPFGRHLLTGSTVCFDPISWFKRAHLIANPSAFFMGLPGLGKSSAVRHLIMGLAAVGVHSMVLGDLKPDYVDLVRVLGGQVIEVGRGRGRINPLDSGAWPASAGDLPRKLRKELREDAHGRRLTMLSSLVHLARNAPPTDREEAILDRALLVLGKRLERTPVIGDVLDVCARRPITCGRWPSTGQSGSVSGYHRGVGGDVGGYALRPVRRCVFRADDDADGSGPSRRLRCVVY